MTHDFYDKTIEQALAHWQTSPDTGLTADEAKRRLEQNGPNRLASAKRKSMLVRILAQFKDFLVIILIIAAVISIVSGGGEDLKDAVIIIAILIVNVVIGITQENRADNALRELKGMSSPKAKVRRNGQLQKIDSAQVVAGDIIIMDAGDYIPADVRIIESINLKIDESALTGESLPVSKNAHTVLDGAVGLGDRVNTAAMGTVVTYGRGVGVVCATGMDTQMGRIAGMLNQTPETVTPLQDKLNAMAKALGIVCIVTCALVFGIGFLYNLLGIGEPRELMQMFMVSVSLAVAAVPEGVAIVATVILAIGVQKMVKSNVIVKRLRAVETLGSTTVICSDKTGTLTQNKMTVVKVFDARQVYEVSDLHTPNQSVALMAEIGVLCNDAEYNAQTNTAIGDPTETAMLALGAKWGLLKKPLNEQSPRVGELPFDSQRKLMSTYNKKENKILMNTKGAPDAIIKRCTHVLDNDGVIPMTDEIRQRLTLQNEQFAASALRVLGFAYKHYDRQADIDQNEEGLTYVGMMCLMDPPREEAKAAIQKCRQAGIHVKMITGDHQITASAIAASLGIVQEEGQALSGAELDGLTDDELASQVENVHVFARVSPEHKVRIVDAIRQNGHIVAMTGDGVNDAPSLKKADIGIAMGIAGTDVSKEAADMVLTDDNFVSIVKAVEQGRTIYGNIRKVTGYLLSCNIGEILIILLAIVFGLPVPLVATQLLFVNLLTDAFPAFALGMEGKESDTMNKPPRNPKEPIINKAMRGSVLLKAVFICAGSLGAFLSGYFIFEDYELAISMCFFTLVASELLVSYNAKTEAFVGFGRALFSNRFLNISTGLSLAILVAVMYVPVLNDLLSTKPITSPVQMLLCWAMVAVPLAGSEITKRMLAAQG